MIKLQHIRDENNKFDVSDVTFEIEEDLTLDQLMEEIRKFLLAIGYQSGSIDEYIEAE